MFLLWLLFSVFFGRHARVPFEHTKKGASGGKAATGCNFGYGQFCLQEKDKRIGNAQAVDIKRKALLHDMLEKVGNIVLVGMHCLGNS